MEGAMLASISPEETPMWKGSGIRRQEAGGRRQEAGGRRQEAGGGRWEVGGGRWQEGRALE
jgi:hypothetical protein